MSIRIIETTDSFIVAKPWNRFLGLAYLCLLSLFIGYGVYYFSEVSAEELRKSGVALFFVAPFILGSAAYFGYKGLSNLLNTTQFVVTPEVLFVRTSPFFSTRRVEISSELIDRVVYTYQELSPQEEVYELAVYTRNKQKLTILKTRELGDSLDIKSTLHSLKTRMDSCLNLLSPE